VSDTLDWRRLYWSGTKGRAVVNGHGRELTEAPVIAGKPVAEIDYLPFARRDVDSPRVDRRAARHE
jgi:hypothetical protein